MIELTLHFERETKRTYRFSTDAEDAPVTVLYIKKSAFQARPASITLKVEPKI